MKYTPLYWYQITGADWPEPGNGPYPDWQATGRQGRMTCWNLS